MNRPSFKEIYMQFAWALSKRSTCSRLQVGAVITTTDFRRVLSVGYNGNATGLPNECDSATPGACGDIHAEANAVINCCEPRATPKYVFVTHLPCKMCAKYLVNLGNVKRVYYDQDYRIRDGLDILNSAGIPCEQLHIIVQGE
jgi:dCMP deaminase